MTPLTLTILSAAVPPARRGLALGIWSGIAGLAVALGPVVGGAVVEGLSWQWIFWLNVPIGIVLLPIALFRLSESKGPNSTLDLPGLALVSTGLLGIVWGLTHGNENGWTSFGVAGPIIAGVALVAAFVLWELRSRAPMVPMRFFRRRAFAAANLTSLLMSFGMFGAIFLLAQFFQIVQGYSPLEAGRADAALDGDADLRGAHRRHPERPHREPSAAHRRHDAHGGRHGVDRHRDLADRGVRRAGARRS